MTDEEALGNPFPGLRPFEEKDNLVFFGRDGQIEELLDRLGRRRFVAVIGTSASGKSSLVRAGLLPALRGGFLAGAGSRWRIALMRPGNTPIAALAESLDTAGILGDDGGPALRTGLARAVLERGELGLIEVVEQAALGADENVLIVVDQFEELFRFRRDLQEGAAFVKLLLVSAAYAKAQVFVLITMRSDFLGDCAQFRDLPETINDGLFLVPRLTRDQLREAIVGPIGVAEGDMSPLLVNRLLNDLGDSPDQLPVLQHALLRTWDAWKTGGHTGRPIDATDFDATGGLARALSTHGDEIYERLPLAIRPVAERIFKALTVRGSDNRDIRRPTALSALPAIVGASEDDVRAAIEEFRAPGRSFVMPPSGVPLGPASVIDISHESLMRIWDRLRAWVDEEAESAQTYRRLADSAQMYDKGSSALLIDPALTIAETWRDENAPTPAWAERYAPGFAAAIQFLDASIAERERQRRAAEEREKAERDAERRRFEMEETAKRERAEQEAALSSERANAAQRLARRTRGYLVVTSIVALLALVLAYASVAERNRALVFGSRLLSRDAQTATNGGDAVTGVLLALEALPKHRSDPFDRPYVNEAGYALENGVANERERLVLRGHDDIVLSVAYAPDGRRFVTSGGDHMVREWDARSGAQLLVMSGHGDWVHGASYSPDGRRIVSASEDRTLRIWDAATGRTLHILHGHTGIVNSARFSPDGRFIVSASDDKTVRLWPATGGAALAVLTGHTDAVYDARFSPDGKRVVSASRDETARIWDVATKTEQRILHKQTDTVFTASWSPDGSVIIAACGDHVIHAYDAATGAVAGSLSGHDDVVLDAEYSHDGKYIVSSSRDRTIRVWKVNDFTQVAVLRGHDDWVNVATFSPDGTSILSGSTDKTVRLWNVSPAAQRLVVRGHTKPLESACFSPDGATILTASDDGRLGLWDARTGALVRFLKAARSEAFFASFSPDGRRIVAAYADKMVRIWDARTGALQRTLRGHTDRVNFAAYSPDGRRIATASRDETVRIWDASSGALLRVLAGHTRSVWSAAFSPDGRLIVSASSDKTLRIWDAGTGATLQTLQGKDEVFNAAAFSPDGRQIVGASEESTVEIWDANSGDLIRTLRGHAKKVESAVFSPDGSRIASASDDDTVRVWDARTGDQIAVLSNEGVVTTAAFSPDGGHIVSASSDKTARVWNLPEPDQALVDAARAHVPRALTDAQRKQELL